MSEEPKYKLEITRREGEGLVNGLALCRANPHFQMLSPEEIDYLTQLIEFVTKATER